METCEWYFFLDNELVNDIELWFLSQKNKLLAWILGFNKISYPKDRWQQFFSIHIYALIFKNNITLFF